MSTGAVRRMRAGLAASGPWVWLMLSACSVDGNAYSLAGGSGGSEAGTGKLPSSGGGGGTLGSGSGGAGAGGEALGPGGAGVGGTEDGAAGDGDDEEPGGAGMGGGTSMQETLCEVDTTEPCWETAEGEALPPVPSAFLGQYCREGVRTCDATGTFGACLGAVGPLEHDSCEEAGADENCNGIPNEGCPCTPGQTRPCGIAQGNCKQGTQSCESGAWGACVGAVEPEDQDSCAEPGDDANCNGTPNDGCPCIGNASEDCNDCGRRTCNPSARAWGACMPATSPPESRCAANSNAVETCGANGRWATEACTSSDSHCSSKCQVGGGVARCVLSAADVDGDSHGDALCASMPGDDCNDSQASVYPGAPESCDGLDNDCDGAVDLLDGRTLSGTNRAASNHRLLSLAWNPKAALFSWVGNSITGAGAGIFFSTLTSNGIPGTPTTPITTPGSDELHDGARIAYSSGYGGSGSFGVVYTSRSKAGVYGHFLPVSDSGTPGTRVSLPQGPPGWGAPSGAIASRQSAEFVSAHSDYNGEILYFGRIQSGSYTNGVTLDTGVANPRIATNGSGAAIVYQVGTSIDWVRVNSSLTLEPAQALTNAGRNADVAATPSGYVMAWRTQTGISLRAFAADGSARCGPTNATFGDGTLNSADDVAVASTAYGPVVFATDTGGGARVFRFDGATCALLDHAEVLPNTTPATAPSIAVGGGKIAIAWTDYPPSDSASRGRVRLLNEALCQ